MREPLVRELLRQGSGRGRVISLVKDVIGSLWPGWSEIA